MRTTYIRDAVCARRELTGLRKASFLSKLRRKLLLTEEVVKITKRKEIASLGRRKRTRFHISEPEMCLKADAATVICLSSFAAPALPRERERERGTRRSRLERSNINLLKKHRISRPNFISQSNKAAKQREREKGGGRIIIRSACRLPPRAEFAWLDLIKCRIRSNLLQWRDRRRQHSTSCRYCFASVSLLI